MKSDQSQAEVIRGLEESLLQPQVRRLAEKVTELLTDDFVEFGSSGRVYDKTQIIALLQQEESTCRRTMTEFTARTLAPGIVLATYRITRRDVGEEHQTHSLRSSLWKLVDGRWQMVFHQGTPAPG